MTGHGSGSRDRPRSWLGLHMAADQRLRPREYRCDTARSAVAPWLASPLPAPAKSSLKDLQVHLSR